MIQKIPAIRARLFAFVCVMGAMVSFVPFHHGWSNYDQNKTLNFKGKIVEATYENPHGMITLEVKDQKWKVVLAPPSRMENRGLTNEMLKVGATAAVVGYPHLKIKDEMRAERITIDNKTTELR